MSAIHLRAKDAEQWAGYLADPGHWRKGYSARTLAYSWQEAQGFPTEVRKVLESCDRFTGAELLIGIPEHQVPLPGGARPSQSDLWGLARSQGHLVSIAVEGKVDEPFGPTLAEWMAEGSAGKRERLGFLLQQLGLSTTPEGTVRYQLLHRTASALIEAKRFYAKRALMLVHSFSPTNNWFEDYAAFARLMGASAGINQVTFAGDRSGVELHLGWVSGDPTYLGK